MNDRGLVAAGELLREASDSIEQACRILTREAARADRLLLDIATTYGHKPAVECSMQELTKISVELANRGNEVGGYGAWLGGAS